MTLSPKPVTIKMLKELSAESQFSSSHQRLDDLVSYSTSGEAGAVSGTWPI
jgi:hypothetical protein